MSAPEKQKRSWNIGDFLHLAELVGLVVTIAMGWQLFKDTGADHERRIEVLEREKVNKELVMEAIKLQSGQIEKLSGAVARDHDLVMQLSAAVTLRPTSSN